LDSDEWSEKRTGRNVTIRFLASGTPAEALKELAQSTKAQIGPNGTCKDFVENCVAWRTHLKNEDPVTLKFSIEEVWVEVHARNEETAFAFARAVVDVLKKEQARD